LAVKIIDRWDHAPGPQRRKDAKSIEHCISTGALYLKARVTQERTQQSCSL